MNLQTGIPIIVLIATLVSIPSFSRQSDAAKPAFEVASIKPSTSADNRVMIGGSPGGHFTVTNATLKMIMGAAYRVRDFQIFGGPNWISTDRWNIEAKAEEGSIPPPKGPPDPTVPDPLGLMVQSLLEDRFHLKIHRETRELPVYELRIAKSGSKVKLSPDQSPEKAPEPGSPPPPMPLPGGPVGRGSVRMGRGSLETNTGPMSLFIMGLSQQLGRPVIDKTGLKGFYDIKLQWTPDFGQGLIPPGGSEPTPQAGDASGPSIFTAVQEQLGLQLESAKGPVEVIVIDGVQKPTEN
jgi:uncharacterized protein (TIGR03435 family)